MKCTNHIDKDAVTVCNHCGKHLCADCCIEVSAEMYCKECAALKVGIAKKEERSPVLAAILSFVIAGSGQIYNGQVGKGILILLTSWLIIPWIIGIVDAFRVANLINQGKIMTKSRMGCLITLIILVLIFWITIVFVAILAAIAIPNFLRARERFKATSVRQTLQIVTASQTNEIILSSIQKEVCI